MEDVILENKQNELRPEVKLLGVLCACLFAGRAWQHLRWTSPLEEIWGLPHSWMIGLGVLWVGLAIVSGAGGQVIKTAALKGAFALGAFTLLLLTLASWQAKSFQIAQLIEHSIQWTLPLLLIYAVSKEKYSNGFILFVKTVIALTFVGHGMYAAGVYTVPGNFIAMTSSILEVDTDGARTFLFMAGTLDFLVAICLFIPRFERYAISYAIVWGSLTAFARVVGYMDFDAPIDSLDRWLFETVYRLGHGGVPLFLYMITMISLPKEEIKEVNDLNS